MTLDDRWYQRPPPAWLNLAVVSIAMFLAGVMWQFGDRSASGALFGLGIVASLFTLFCLSLEKKS